MPIRRPPGGGLPVQVFDPDRLAAVRRTGLLDTGPEEAFDRLARLAATLLGTPFAFVTIVDETRSFWKSCIGVAPTGLADRQNPVEQSFCQYVIGSGAELVVTDTTADERTRDNPSIELTGVRAWAGFPVRSPAGQVLGTFCAVDTVTRDWTPHDVDVLETLAHAASGEIARRIASTTLTRPPTAPSRPPAGGGAAPAGAGIPARKRPELVATGPGQVCTWDITKLPGPSRGVYYDAYVMIDIFSRYVVGWKVAARVCRTGAGVHRRCVRHPRCPTGGACRPGYLDDVEEGR
jgi:hypothetical protein